MVTNKSLGLFTGRLSRVHAVLAMLLFACLAPLVSGSLSVQADKLVKVGVFDFFPLSHTSQTGAKGEREGGLFVSLLRHAAGKENWSLQLVPGTLEAAMRLLDAGEIDVLVAVPYSRELAGQYDFTRESVISTWAQVYARKDSSVQSWFDLPAKAVGMLQNDPYNQEMRSTVRRLGIACEFVEFKRYDDLFQALQNGWIDAAVADRLSGALLEANFAVTRTPIIFAPIELRFAVARGRNQDLIAALDYHLEVLKQDPHSLYYHLINQILGEAHPSRVPGYLLWGLVIAVGIAAFLGATSFVLRRQITARTAQLSANNKELQREIRMRRDAEQALRESRERYRTIVEDQTELISRYLPDGTITFVNGAFCRYFGKKAEELLGNNLGLLFDSGQLAEQRRKMARLDPANPVVTLDQQLRLPDGENRWLRRTDRAILDAHGRIAEFQSVASDITQRKRAEEELLRIEKLESLGILAGGIAHDFNNVLSAILGNVSLAQMYSDSADQAVRKRLAAAEQAAMRAKDLTRQLLTLSRGGTPVKETTSVAALIDESLSFALTGANVKGEVATADDLWPVESDAGQISQVIQNIVINAKQAMPGGGIVRIAARNVEVDGASDPPLEAGRYVKISIQDHGVGIPREHLSRIFDPYFTTKPHGNGLGLATSYSIVRNHGGKLEVQSEPGQGTTFHLYLPACGGKTPSCATAQTTPAAGKGKILVMDDQIMLREIAGHMLTHLGYEVRLAKDGAEAIRKYKEAKDKGRPFDAVIMDLTIPGGLGGKDALRGLLEIDPAANAIVSSGYANDSVMEDHTRYGFKAAVVKPYRIHELSQVLKRVVLNGD